MYRIFIFLSLFLFMSCTTRYVLEHRQFGLGETYTVPKGWVVVGMDTVRFDGGGVVKAVVFKIPEKDKK